ncbi:hypothetical protein ASPVEDRAFT_155429 [Aspergillus versicolor CBS 583.65]|uniref:Uncharacterized protein n=1 Tax=Aspergillus versicolor CBS 583.65 TaxID=1036611 RepID=A0A1L9Q1G7_ASPVE|nr:uncharacterized protein ASPVEDRAFT_155429 [Aspergillus versicolor CBS 583.65]OJJ07624.1 hypothetical protein ASPVEDRAFT_155429 [Aspergillus versicolor CBS 583.65]
MTADSKIPLSSEEVSSREVEWYHPTLTWLPDTTAQLFREYSAIPQEEIVKHIQDIREKAWDIYPYPCIGIFRFIDFGAYFCPVYPDVLKRLAAGQTLLDLGCCFGQDLRKLVFDGASSENLLGVDLHAGFHNLGYELFRDKETLKARLYSQSIFDKEFLPEWQGKIDIVHMGAFLHLFSYDQQKVIIAKVTKLLRGCKGSLAFGRHAGAEEGGPISLNTKWDLFAHSDATLKKLWNEEGAGKGEWEVNTQLVPFEDNEVMDGKAGSVGRDDRIRMMYFSATRA